MLDGGAVDGGGVDEQHRLDNEIFAGGDAPEDVTVMVEDEKVVAFGLGDGPFGEAVETIGDGTWLRLEVGAWFNGSGRGFRFWGGLKFRCWIAGSDGGRCWCGRWSGSRYGGIGKQAGIFGAVANVAEFGADLLQFRGVIGSAAEGSFFG